jgi:hypothetical protein
VELTDAVLNRLIRHHHALVLAQVLDPRLDHEDLDVPSGLARIAEDIPLDRAVSAPYVGQRANGRDERIGRAGSIWYSTGTSTGPLLSWGMMSTCGSGQCIDGVRSSVVATAVDGSHRRAG